MAAAWLEAANLRPGNPAGWREVIHHDRMQVWCRIADNAEDAELVHWFHDRRKLKNTALGGKMNQVGRLWNRLLPLRSQGDGPRAVATTARPVSPTTRPAALARASALARPSVGRAEPPPRHEVWIDVHQGAFLETVVLFPEQVVLFPEQKEAPAFIKSMNQGPGAEAGFRTVRF